MKARDVMVSPAITVKTSCSVKEAAKILLQRGISAVPVVDDRLSASSAKATCCIAPRQERNARGLGGSAF